MTNLLSVPIIKSAVRRTGEIYCSLFTKSLWLVGGVILLPMLLPASLLHVYILETCVLVLMGHIIILSHTSRNRDNASVKLVPLLLIYWLVITQPSSRPWHRKYKTYLFSELLSFKVSVGADTIISACTLGVIMNILLLSAYCLLDHQFKWSEYIRSLDQSLKLVWNNPLALVVFAQT